MKNAPKRGRSARRGNAASPYSKHGKIPYRYAPAYYAWKRAVTGRKDKQEAA